MDQDLGLIVIGGHDYWGNTHIGVNPRIRGRHYFIDSFARGCNFPRNENHKPMIHREAFAGQYACANHRR